MTEIPRPTRWETGFFRQLALFLAPWLVAATSVLASPSTANAHSGSDQYGEAIIWFVVVILIGVVALVIALVFAITWLVGRLGRSKGDKAGPVPRQELDAGGKVNHWPPAERPCL